MASESPVAEQLAALGVPLPVWPEETADSIANGGWVGQGLRYAEGIRLWHAQLKNSLSGDQRGDCQFFGMVREAARVSAWEQAVCRYVLSDVDTTLKASRLRCVAQLVSTEQRTPAQLLGASLALAADGRVATAFFGIQRIVQLEYIPAQACLEICALLISACQPVLVLSDDCGNEGDQSWSNAVHFQCRVAHLLATATHCAGGVCDREALLHCLDAVSMLAGSERCREREASHWVMLREQRQRSRMKSVAIVRTIHHLACSGGTVICKCLASMPHVALLGEVNPHNRHGSLFEPTNLLLQLERSYRPLSIEEIRADFLRQIGHAQEICRQDDVDLILRDHSHTDFCMGTAPSIICPVIDYLNPHYGLLSVVTVRHPLDSYLGLLAQQWENQFSPSTLEEYSRRYLAFLDRYTHLPLRRYEDFCRDPEAFMEELCGLLDIAYSAEFLQHFGGITLSGDSGRKNLDQIALRPRRPIPDEVARELESSQAYGLLLQRLAYGPAL